MPPYDSTADTLAHIAEVRSLLEATATDLLERGGRHDASKLDEPEKAVFDEFTPKLRDSTYGSPEYKQFLAGMGKGLAHHYELNDHHPEFFQPGKVHEVDVGTEPAFHPSGDEYTLASAVCSGCDWIMHSPNENDVRDAAALHERENFDPGGIHAMNLIQLTECLCDWIAATHRHADGDIHRSIDQNAERFGYGEDLARLLHRSADAILALDSASPPPPTDPGMPTN